MDLLLSSDKTSVEEKLIGAPEIKQEPKEESLGQGGIKDTKERKEPKTDIDEDEAELE